MRKHRRHIKRLEDKNCIIKELKGNEKKNVQDKTLGNVATQIQFNNPDGKKQEASGTRSYEDQLAQFLPWTDPENGTIKASA